MAQSHGNPSSSTSIVSEYSLFNGSETECRSTLPYIDHNNDRCLNWMDNTDGASVSSSCSSFGPDEVEEEEEEQAKERENEPAALCLNWMDNNDGASVSSSSCSSFGPEEEEEEEEEQAKERENEPAMPVAGISYFLTLRGAACTASPYARNIVDMSIYMDACSLQRIFDRSLVIMDQLQQMYLYNTLCVQDARENDEPSFAPTLDRALYNAMMHWRLLENTVKEYESNVTARFFQMPEPYEIDMKMEISAELFYLLFGRIEFEYYSCVRDLMKLISEWISNAEELFVTGGVYLAGHGQVRKRMENDGDCKMLDDDEDWIP